MLTILKARRTRPYRVGKHEQQFARAFLSAIRSASIKTDKELLLKALNSWNISEAIAMIRWDQTQLALAKILPKHYQIAWEVGTRASHKSIVRKELGYSITGPVDPEAVRLAQERTGILITEWGATSREALSILITRALEEGMPIAKLLKLIMESGIGLTKRQAAAVAARRAQLLAQGVPASRIEALILKYAAQLLRYRAEMIAMTEIKAAYTAGKQAQWKRMLADGRLNPLTAHQVWVTSPDERTCEFCISIDGFTAKLFPGPSEPGQPPGEPFADDPRLGLVYGPPAHPHCKCNIIMVPE